MLGAIIGDIVGSPYEFDENNIKTKNFPLFRDESVFTDDTVMTIAVAEGLMQGYGNPERTRREIISSMHRWGRAYPDAGYGANFRMWLYRKDPKPYKSFGNGAAMRVSAAAWLYEDLQTVEQYAGISASVTHDHPEGIKGAQATAAAIFLARDGIGKEKIKAYIEGQYKYDLSRTCDEIRPGYHHVESCQQTVPEAITAFLEGSDFEDVIRTAVSLGGDCDTLTAIAGSIAEGCFPIPDALRKNAEERLDDHLLEALERYRAFLAK